mmetsp:Transcript_41187/g.56119  ORF Transcript_41187/g.56119 Transcript_41187/m.56119 type:complete len:308 (-) Transcript_41187:811-1734(-)
MSCGAGPPRCPSFPYLLCRRSARWQRGSFMPERWSMREETSGSFSVTSSSRAGASAASSSSSDHASPHPAAGGCSPSFFSSPLDFACEAELLFSSSSSSFSKTGFKPSEALAVGIKNGARGGAFGASVGLLRALTRSKWNRLSQWLRGIPERVSAPTAFGASVKSPSAAWGIDSSSPSLPLSRSSTSAMPHSTSSGVAIKVGFVGTLSRRTFGSYKERSIQRYMPRRPMCVVQMNSPVALTLTDVTAPSPSLKDTQSTHCAVGRSQTLRLASCPAVYTLRPSPENVISVRCAVLPSSRLTRRLVTRS